MFLPDGCFWDHISINTLSSLLCTHSINRTKKISNFPETVLVIFLSDYKLESRTRKKLRNVFWFYAWLHGKFCMMDNYRIWCIWGLDKRSMKEPYSKNRDCVRKKSKLLYTFMDKSHFIHATKMLIKSSVFVCITT